MFEAEHLVAHLEEIYEFSRIGKDEGSSSKKGNDGDQAGKSRTTIQGKLGNRETILKISHGTKLVDHLLLVTNSCNKIKLRELNAGKGKLVHPVPHNTLGTNYHPGHQSNGSGQHGRGRGQGKPRVAIMATSDELRRMADYLD